MPVIVLLVSVILSACVCSFYRCLSSFCPSSPSVYQCVSFCFQLLSLLPVHTVFLQCLPSFYRPVIVLLMHAMLLLVSVIRCQPLSALAILFPVRVILLSVSVLFCHLFAIVCHSLTGVCHISSCCLCSLSFSPVPVSLLPVSAIILSVSAIASYCRRILSFSHCMSSFCRCLSCLPGMLISVILCQFPVHVIVLSLSVVRLLSDNLLFLFLSTDQRCSIPSRKYHN